MSLERVKDEKKRIGKFIGEVGGLMCCQGFGNGIGTGQRNIRIETGFPESAEAAEPFSF